MLGRVVLFDHRKERRAEGGVAVVTYEVYSSPQAARTLYEDYFAGVRSANRFQDRGYRFRLANRDQPHTCVEETAQTWCLVVIDRCESRRPPGSECSTQANPQASTPCLVRRSTISIEPRGATDPTKPGAPPLWADGDAIIVT